MLFTCYFVHNQSKDKDSMVNLKIPKGKLNLAVKMAANMGMYNFRSLLGHGKKGTGKGIDLAKLVKEAKDNEKKKGEDYEAIVGHCTTQVLVSRVIMD